MPQAGFADSIALPEFRRSTVEDMIERLIELLDDLDPDPEAEPECEDEGVDSDYEYGDVYQ